MTNPLTLRGWVAAILIGLLSAAISTLVVLQVRHWLIDEAQLHQIVQLIQSGQIAVRPAAPSAPPAPAPPTTPSK